MAKKEKAAAPAEETKVEAANPEIPAPKGGGKTQLIIIAVAALAIGIGGAMAAMKFMGGSPPPPAEVKEAEPAGDPDSPPPIEAPRRAGSESSASYSAHGAGPADGDPGPAAESFGPVNIEFKPFIVNLNDGGGKRFLKLTMSIETENETLGGEINAKMPQFRDIILLLLSSLSYDDIATLDGKMRLRNQILNRINTQLNSGKIRNIYFSEFVVQ